MGTIHYQGQEGGCVSRNTDVRFQPTNNSVRDHTRTEIPSTTVDAYNTTQHQVPIPRRTQVPISLDDIRLP